MGTAEIQGELWSKVPQDWATLQEPMHKPLWEAMLDRAMVGSGTRILDAGCGGGGASVRRNQQFLPYETSLDLWLALNLQSDSIEPKTQSPL